MSFTCISICKSKVLLYPVLNIIVAIRDSKELIYNNDDDGLNGFFLQQVAAVAVPQLSKMDLSQILPQLGQEQAHPQEHPQEHRQEHPQEHLHQMSPCYPGRYCENQMNTCYKTLK